MPPLAWHLEVQQGRTSAVLGDLDELAGPAPHQPPSRRRAHRQHHHHPHRPHRRRGCLSPSRLSASAVATRRRVAASGSVIERRSAQPMRCSPGGWRTSSLSRSVMRATRRLIQSGSCSTSTQCSRARHRSVRWSSQHSTARAAAWGSKLPDRPWSSQPLTTPSCRVRERVSCTRTCSAAPARSTLARYRPRSATVGHRHVRALARSTSLARQRAVSRTARALGGPSRLSPWQEPSWSEQPRHGAIDVLPTRIASARSCGIRSH